MSAPRQVVFSIAPHAPFLRTLVTAVMDGKLLPDWPRSGPFWLTDITIVLPTRRARRSLAEAFLAAGSRLLPDIRSFGGEPADEEPFLPPIDAPPLAQAVSALERRLLLAQMIAAWAATPAGAGGFAVPPSDAEMLALAESLGQLLDDLTIEGVSLAELRSVAPAELAANWQQTLAFVEIVAEHWPQVLTERGKSDAAMLRNERLRRQAAAASLIFGERPVIAAGSTGSIPATAELLMAISRLPRGVLVLPGVDTTLGEAQRATLLDPTAAPHGHAQYGLAQLLRRLGQRMDAVAELATASSSRTRAVREALALPETTGDWPAMREDIADVELAGAFKDVAIIVARTEDEEARAIALMARDRLARQGTVGIVSPDRNLARRIAAELRRYAVDIDDGAGVPLFQAPAGRLARQLLTLIGEGVTPVDLVALLSSRWVTLGMDRAELRRHARALDAVLRGRSVRPGFAGIHETVAACHAEGARGRRVNEAQGTAIGAMLDTLEAALAPLTAVLGGEQFSAAELAVALMAALAAVTRDADAELPGLTELAAWADDLVALGKAGPRFSAVGLDALMVQLLVGIDVRNAIPERTDIAIWGQLEARLQNPDLMILAGLNEEVWPQVADTGPWLSRGMRLKAGLEPPERRQGQAAHDFEMAMGNAQVAIALADRRGTSPAIASRLVQRLEAFVGERVAKEMRARGDIWLRDAARIDAVAGAAKPAVRPLPSPPVGVRPRRLSVTEIETLFRSPYDVYAKHVLRLLPLEPLGEEPGPRERGNLIHAVFAEFIGDGHDVHGSQAWLTMVAMAEREFSALEAIGERRDIWLRRFKDSARQFLGFEIERDLEIAQRRAEIKGEWLLANGFRLHGRADRVDSLTDGSVAIIDFKTGGVPTPAMMKAFEAPQLLLEAAMVAAGAFEQVPPTPASQLSYIKIGLGPEAFDVTDFKLHDGDALADAVTEIVRRVNRHVEALLLGPGAMAAQLLPDQSRRFAGAYEHLARAEEWTLAAGEEEF